MNSTEQRNPLTKNIDRASTADMLKMLQHENEAAVKAVGEIERVCDAISERMLNGGRLIYVGAGTSGRLGVLDAAECPPTFGVSPELVVGVIAGGNECMFRASENAEDNAKAAIRDMKRLDLSQNDSVVGISASGNAAYPAEALKYAASCGCLTVGLTSNRGSRLDLEPALSIVTETGAEPITGSTRMKAGSAQKMVLNMLSTGVMLRLGHIYENLMINLKPSNLKLRKRCISIVSELTGEDLEASELLLEKNDWCIRKAVSKETI